MQPYQLASKETQKEGELPLEALKTASSLGATALGGGLALNRVLPFLSKYISPELAIKGLTKIDPRFGKFIDLALKNGQSFDEVKDFIKEKAEGNQAQPNAQPKQQNIIQQHDDKLHAFIESEMNKGRSALEAGAIARTDKKFEDSIEKIEKAHKTNWSSILESIYGQSQPAQTQQQQVQPQQSGNADQALLAALDKILKM